MANSLRVVRILLYIGWSGIYMLKRLLADTAMAPIEKDKSMRYTSMSLKYDIMICIIVQLYLVVLCGQAAVSRPFFHQSDESLIMQS